MVLQEMVDLVRQHHPDIGLEEVVRMINRAQDDFTMRTRMIKEANIFTINNESADQRYYGLEDEFLEVIRVDMEDSDGKLVEMKRSQNIPADRDFT